MKTPRTIQQMAEQLAQETGKPVAACVRELESLQQLSVICTQLARVNIKQNTQSNSAA